MADTGDSGRLRHVGRVLVGRWRVRADNKRHGHHAPMLWSVWVAAPIVLAVGSLLALLLYHRMLGLAVPVEVPGGPARVDSVDVIRTTLSVLAFSGALLAGLYAYRKQRLAEGDAARADTQQFSDRYTKAAEQLGSDKAAIRLAGIYAMARLADDWIEQRQTCIDVLCAYLRLPYIAPGEPEHQPSEDEVRDTLVQVIVAHLRFGPDHSWSSADFNFQRAYLKDVDFIKTTFSGKAWFSYATFAGYAFFGGATFNDIAWFRETKFLGNEVSFEDATFKHMTSFEDAAFDSVSFERATFASNEVSFKQSTFSGDVNLEDANFSGPVDGLPPI